MTCSMRLMLRFCERQRCPGRGSGWALAAFSSARGGHRPPDGTRKVPGAQPARSKVPGQIRPDGTLIEGLLRCPTNYPVLRAGCKVPSAQGKVLGHVIPDATLKVSC